MRLKTYFVAILILAMGVAKSQDREITGKVIIAENGRPLKNVRVSVKGTSIRTKTDKDGNYKIIVPNPDKRTLVFKYRPRRYPTEEVKIGQRKSIDMFMTPWVR
ncbi:MAG: carboxypeptidase-like regulatory domain-containing protein [Cyclobacteriaceae bacterium]|nr:carboxypeptidase-like regulatory domain-containing protein [Cyclobacteriaceae bacterium]